MSEEEMSEMQEPLDRNRDTAGEEAEDETPLKTPKKKFVMTPARLETLRKGREKRAENVRVKKDIEAKLKEDEKTQKQAIKKRVEEEFAKVKEVPPEPVAESEESESDTDTEEEQVAPVSTRGGAVSSKAKRCSPRAAQSRRQSRSATVQPSLAVAKKSPAPPQHVVVFI